MDKKKVKRQRKREKEKKNAKNSANIAGKFKYKHLDNNISKYNEYQMNPRNTNNQKPD